MKIAFRFVGIFLLSVLFFTCKHLPTEVLLPGNGTPVDTSHNQTPDNDSVCFNSQILPLIKSGCAQAGCHDSITQKEELMLNSYAGIMKIVDAKNPYSKLLRYMTQQGEKIMPPAPQQQMDTASVNLVRRWIMEGAKNRICNPTACDTANVTYTTHIASVIATYCKSCHQAGNASGGVQLDSYTLVKTHTLSPGKLLCTITANGCGLMPKGGPAMSACNIRKIQIWAAANCPQ